MATPLKKVYKDDLEKEYRQQGLNEVENIIDHVKDRAQADVNKALVLTMLYSVLDLMHKLDFSPWTSYYVKKGKHDVKI